MCRLTRPDLFHQLDRQPIRVGKKGEQRAGKRIDPHRLHRHAVRYQRPHAGLHIGYAQRQVATIDPAAVAPVELVKDGPVAGTFLPLTAVWSIGVVSGMVPMAAVG